MTVCLIHGIVDNWSRASLAHRLYVPREAMVAHLRNRAAPYGRWQRDWHECDVLTVDDATGAGAAACLLARRLGHEVIFFINPLDVISGQRSFWSFLDAAIDGRTVQDVTYENESFDLNRLQEVRRLRRFVKQRLRSQSVEVAHAAVQDVVHLLGAEDSRPPAFTYPVSLPELRELRDAGVRIESHGWSHVEICPLSPPELAEHIERPRHWLRQELAVDAHLYAVPFGESEVPSESRHLLADGYFLADGARPLGPLSPGCWNRLDLTGTLQDS